MPAALEAVPKERLAVAVQVAAPWVVAVVVITNAR